MKRPLADTLTDLIDGVLHGEPIPLTVTSVRVDLPMEVRLALRDGDLELLADVPEWRWQTGWEPLRARLRVNWEAGAVP